MIVTTQTPVGSCNVESTLHVKNEACIDWKPSGLVVKHEEYKPGKLSKFFSGLGNAIGEALFGGDR